MSNRFVRQTNEHDVRPQERGISINAQIITSKEKRIEIASDFYQIPIEDINYIPQYEYKTIEEYLTTGCDVVFQEFPPIYTEPLPGIIIRQ